MFAAKIAEILVTLALGEGEEATLRLLHLLHLPMIDDEVVRRF